MRPDEHTVTVENVVARAPGQADRATGVVAFVNATINGLVVDGITLRRGLDGVLRLGFPKRRDAYGQVHAIVRPAHDGVRREITSLLLTALGHEGAATARPEAQGEDRP